MLACFEINSSPIQAIEIIQEDDMSEEMMTEEENGWHPWDPKALIM